MGRSRTNHQGGGLREAQDKFVRLIAQDVLNSEACRIVGIHRRTVTRWRLRRTILNMAGESVHYHPWPASTSSAPPIAWLGRGSLFA